VIRNSMIVNICKVSVFILSFQSHGKKNDLRNVDDHPKPSLCLSLTNWPVNAWHRSTSLRATLHLARCLEYLPHYFSRPIERTLFYPSSSRNAGRLTRPAMNSDGSENALFATFRNTPARSRGHDKDGGHAYGRCATSAHGEFHCSISSVTNHSEI
jgi:hypothetical protein